MNKFMKIGCILVGVSVVFLFLAFAINGFSFKGFADNEYKQNTYTSTSNVSSIYVDDSNTDVELKRSADDKVHVYYTSSKKYSYKIQENNGRLVINKENNRKWYEFINFSFTFSRRDLVIEVPSRTLSELNVETSNDSITLDNISSDSIYLDTSNGSVDVTNTSAKSISIKSSNDSITCEDTKTSTGELHCETSNGDINLARIEANSIYAKTSNDGISLEQVSLQTKASFITSNGCVDGTICGSLSDFKQIFSETSNGDNSLPDGLVGSSGRKELRVDTSNDDIDIQFTGQ